jgi:hypothetical protein
MTTAVLTVTLAVIIFGALVGYTVRRTGTTTGVVEIWASARRSRRRAGQRVQPAAMSRPDSGCNIVSLVVGSVRRMTFTTRRGQAPTSVAALVGIVLVLSACGTGASQEGASSLPAPQPLGSTIHVHGTDLTNRDLTHDGADYDGTVTAEASPVQCRQPDGGQTLAIHILANATKGGIPTAYWSLETENAVPISNEGLQEPGIGKPPLGALVSSTAKGYITFKIPPRTTPTGLDLLASTDVDGQKIARWSISSWSESTTPCLASASTTPTP